jgi:target of rapamycin complex 2 subunit MAPKAP1
MNSDDLAKNLAQLYVTKLSSSSSSPIKEKISDEIENFYVYPGLDNNDENDEDLLSQSFDINFTQEAPFSFRFRTNTTAKLEKLCEIKKKRAQIKVVKVDDSVIKLNQEIEDDDELFIRKELSKVTIAPKSKLTEQLETLPPIKLNKFREYSTFDGSSYPANETKTIQVFITTIPELRDYPIKCCVHATAKIEEFMGFILFKTTNIYPEYTDIIEEVRSYGLFISDETGEPDVDFPALDLNEQVVKYQFTYLAMAKARHVPQFSQRTLSVASDTTNVIFSSSSIKRQSSVETNQSLHRNTSDAMTDHFTMIEAPIYRAYRVTLITKKHFRTEVQLGISAEKIEIDPLQQKNTSYFFKQKSSHFVMDAVAFCEITTKKSSRFEFRIAYNPLFFDPFSANSTLPVASTSFSSAVNNSYTSNSLSEVTTPTSFALKFHTFETDPTSAEEIVIKVNNILLLKTSSVRREFINRQEKNKRSFIRKRRFPI